MPRFFVPGGAAVGETVLIRGDDARHIGLSLRMRVGDELTVCGSDGKAAFCLLKSITPELVEAECVRVGEPFVGEPPYFAVLYQAVVKGDKFDSIVQKAVETGVGAIVPVLCDRSVSRPDDKAFGKKLERWNRIAKEASGQCGRAVCPAILGPLTFDEAVGRVGSDLNTEQNGKSGFTFICCLAEGTVPLSDLILGEKNVGKGNGTVSFFIGPEGGFSERETALASRNGILPVSLGDRVLRTETASSFVLAWLSLAFENR